MRDTDRPAISDGLPSGREFLASADGLVARSRGRRRLDAAADVLVEAAYGAATGLFAGCWMGLAGCHVSAVASAIAGAAASVALKVKSSQLAKLVPAVLAVPGGRALARGLLDRLDAGPVALRDKAAWIVFDGPASAPRLLSERAYRSLLRVTPTMVEVEAIGDGIVVTRYANGRPDSSLSGEPGVAMYALDGTLRGAEWYVAGRPAGKDEALRAHDLLEPPPTYAEEAFAPRI